jgi:xylose isomerase
MGDYLLGWDTDQFPTDLYLTTQTMLRVLKYGGFTAGGVNFDAKVRRESFELDDLFLAHIAGMDAFARGLKAAAAIRKDGRVAEFVKNRYATWDSGIGAKIEAGKATFADCEKHALKIGEVSGLQSGRQELLESIINEFI